MKVVPLCALFTFSVLFMLLHAAVSEKAIRLKISPLVSIEPARLAIQVRVAPTAEDRWIRVDLDSGAFYRSSGWEVTSDQPLYSWQFVDVPAGEYQVVAAIGHGEHIRALDSVHVKVAERF